jgi:hypothetical protein
MLVDDVFRVSSYDVSTRTVVVEETHVDRNSRMSKSRRRSNEVAQFPEQQSEPVKQVPEIGVHVIVVDELCIR